MQTLLIKANGLYTFPNRLSSVPTGALVKAKNVIINRDSIIESRRGFKLYGNATIGGSSNTAHQLLTYKGRLLRHYGTSSGKTLEFDSDGFGTFLGFTLIFSGDVVNTSTVITNITSTSQLSKGMGITGTGVPTNTTIFSILGPTSIQLSQAANATNTGVSLTFTQTISEVDLGLRIKGIEANSNFYFTTSNGIKKISVSSASDLNTATITDAGGIKALDVQLSLNSNTPFFNQESIVAYRVVWGIKDANTNEILGTPSSRAVISNGLTALLIPNFNGLLTNLDTINTATGIHAGNYHATYSVATGSTASTLRTELIALTSGLDTDIPDFTLTNVSGSGTVVTFTTSTSANNILSIGDVVTVTGVNPSAYNKTYTVLTVSGTTITASDAAVGVYVSGGSLKRNKYTLITQPVVLSTVPTTDELQSIQDYYNNIVATLEGEPTGIITTQPGFTSATTASGVTVKFTIPQGVTTAYFYQIYRTAQTASSTGVTLSSLDPGDEQELVYEANPTNTDLVNGYVQVDDITPDSFRGANLYTNPNTGDGIQQANDIPPISKDLTSFKGYIFYANTQTKQRKQINMLSVSKMVADTSTFTITDGTTTNTYTFSTTENSALKKVLISTAATPAQQVDESARSLVRVINQDPSEIVYAYYLSGPDDVPGMISFESRSLSQSAFYFNVNDASSTGSQFDPALPISGNTVISDNEVSPNRIYYSKFQEPEAVPLVNTIDVGAKDKNILRVLALRDNLFVLKEEAIYRISGLVAPFTVSLFDSSTILEAPDSAVVLNNLIYCYASQGVARVSDTGVEVISRPIEDQLIKLTIPTYTNFKTATFGVSYESDRSYYLSTVTLTGDTFATQCFRYNTFTQTWSQADLSKRCGIVNSTDDRMYFGATDTNFIEQERKNFDRTDYADREISFTLSSGDVSGDEVLLSNLNNISVGDVMVQVQYLTIGQFNQLLMKLDADSILSPSNYYSTLQSIPGDALNTKLDSLITKIAADPGRTAVAGSTSGATYTALSPVSTDFSAIQTTFNGLAALLNSDVGVGYKNFLNSNGTVLQEIIIESLDTTKNSVALQYAYPLIQGPLLVYNHINCDVQWVPQYMQDVSMTKQVFEGTLLFEDSSYSECTLSYASDLSPNFEDNTFVGFGNGNFGNFIFGNGIYGGDGSGIPFRTLIPREKQRCRYINVEFKHSIAREAFAIYGLSLTYNTVSQRGYR